MKLFARTVGHRGKCNIDCDHIILSLLLECSLISTSIFSVCCLPLFLSKSIFIHQTQFLFWKGDRGTCAGGRVQVHMGGGLGTGRLAEEIKRVASLV